MKKILILVFCFAFFQSPSQTTEIDSIKNYINTSKNYWEVTNKCMTVTRLLMYSDNVNAKKYLQKGYIMAKKKNDYINIGMYYFLSSQFADIEANYEKSIKLSDSAIYFFDKGIGLQKNANEKEKNTLNKINTYVQKATALGNLGKTEDAIKIYQFAIKEWEKTNNPEKHENIAIITTNMGGLFINIGNYKKVLEYDKKGLNILKKSKNIKSIKVSRDIANLYLYVSDDYYKLNDKKKAAIYIDSSKSLVEKVNEPNLWQIYLSKKGKMLANFEHYDEAISRYKKAITYIQKIGNKYNEATLMRNIGEILIIQNKFAEARKYINEAWKEAKPLKKFDDTKKYYKAFIELESKSGNYKEAFNYSELLRKFNDSLNEKNTSDKIYELDTKYQTEKKELQIKSLTQQNDIKDLNIKRRYWITIALSIAIIGMCGFAYSQYRNFKTKKALLLVQQDNAIAEERLRIASDMHDDVGSGLSRIRYIVGAVLNNQTELKQGLTKVTEISDDAVQKMKEIIWSLNESNQNLEDLIYYIRGQMSEMAENANVSFVCQLPENIPSVFFGWKRNRSTYLLVKESINNALKHAEAKTIKLDFEISNDLQITITDDGKGFDTTKNFTGNGLNNYKKRIKELNAKFELKSEIGKGTTFLFYLPLSN